MLQEPRISGRKKKLIPKKASEDKEEEEVASGSRWLQMAQDDQSGGSQDASVSQPSKDELKLWPVLIEGKTVWVEFDTKPSPEVRVAQLM